SGCSIRLPRIQLSAPVGQTLQRQHSILGLQPGGQCLSAEGHAGNDSGTEPPTSNRLAYGGDRPADQSAPARVDRILRTICAVGSVPLAQIRQSDATSLGDAEVQALQSAQDPRESLSAKIGSGKRGPVRTLAARYDRHVCLMGAEGGESLTLGSARGWR